MASISLVFKNPKTLSISGHPIARLLAEPTVQEVPAVEFRVRAEEDRRIAARIHAGTTGNRES
jgi:hypothetical protein